MGRIMEGECRTHRRENGSSVSPMINVLFDDSLPRLIEAVRRTLGDQAWQDGTVLRDATGRLSFVAAQEATSERETINRELYEALGPYARPDGVVAFMNDPGAAQ